MSAESFTVDVVIDSIPYAAFVADPERRILHWNGVMAELTGIPKAEAIGAGCDVIGFEAGGDGCPACENVGGQPPDWEPVALLNRAGDHVRLLRHIHPVMDSVGSPLGFVVVLADQGAHLPVETERIPLQESDAVARRLQGKSHGMRDVRERVRLAAQSEATVLILGETGTGKELVAEAIHEASDRREGPLVKVNCSALSEGLLESELFGHVKGAFTGAIKDKIGRFEAAEGGTIFLDEIGDISPLIQLKLLRTLQERCFERVGESVTREMNVRVITATNRDLRGLVRSGDFREDFYYRIRVFTVHVPPLRERREDIPILSSLFIHRFREQTGKPIERLAAPVNRVFMDYCWPGNVRELENAIEHAFVTSDSDEVGLFDLPIELRLAEMRAAECMRTPTSGQSAMLAAAMGYDAPSAPVPRKYGKDELVAALQAVNWNKAEAARRLGVARTTVWRQMRQWGISLDRAET